MLLLTGLHNPTGYVPTLLLPIFQNTDNEKDGYTRGSFVQRMGADGVISEFQSMKDEVLEGQTLVHSRPIERDIGDPAVFAVSVPDEDTPLVFENVERFNSFARNFIYDRRYRQFAIFKLSLAGHLGDQFAEVLHAGIVTLKLWKRSPEVADFWARSGRMSSTARSKAKEMLEKLQSGEIQEDKIDEFEMALEDDLIGSVSSRIYMSPAAGLDIRYIGKIGYNITIREPSKLIQFVELPCVVIINLNDHIAFENLKSNRVFEYRPVEHATMIVCGISDDEKEIAYYRQNGDSSPIYVVERTRDELIFGIKGKLHNLGVSHSEMSYPQSDTPRS